MQFQRGINSFAETFNSGFAGEEFAVDDRTTPFVVVVGRRLRGLGLLAERGGDQVVVAEKAAVAIFVVAAALGIEWFVARNVDLP